MNSKRRCGRGMPFVPLVVTIMSLAAPSTCAAAAGVLDPSFSGNGKLTTTFSRPGAGAAAVAIDSKGRIVAVGGNDNFRLARYLPDGTLDSSFDGDGRVRTDFGGYDFARGVAIDSQDRIVTVGVTISEHGESDVAVARYNPDGSIDASFGSGGKVTTDTGGQDGANAVTIGPQGRILAAGWADPSPGTLPTFGLFRYLANGDLDPSFGTGGVATVPIYDLSEIKGVAIDSQERIVAVGERSDEAQQHYSGAFARFEADGAVDPSFANGGTGLMDDLANAVAIDSRDRIVIAGERFRDHGRSGDFALHRLRKNGTPDPSFSGNGNVTTDFANRGDLARAVTIDSRGRIVAAGLTVHKSPAGLDFALARYRPDGRLTPAFGGDGKVSTNFIGNDSAAALATDSRGRIVAAGSTWRRRVGARTRFALARYTRRS
jgi:uncharacterized delta-60 repeat protein